jgi:hypothetical protein
VPVSATRRRVFTLSRPRSPLFRCHLHHLTSPSSSRIGRHRAARALAPSTPHRLRHRRRCLPRPRLRRLGIAGEDLFPCAVSPPHRPRAGVTPACRRPSSARSRATAASRASHEGERRACVSQRAVCRMGHVLVGRCARPARQDPEPHARYAGWLCQCCATGPRADSAH